jgi:hypothetical protein
MAEEISLRRLFLSRFSEKLMERLRETEGSTLNVGLSSGTAGRLPSLGEVNEPDSSSNGSRSSSRSSRRSRSRPNSRGALHDRSRRAPGDALGEPNHHISGLRSHSSSSSLRLGPDGEPLEDGPDLTDPHVSRGRYFRLFRCIQFKLHSIVWRENGENPHGRGPMEFHSRSASHQISALKYTVVYYH